MMFLYLVPTGMNDPLEPTWGSWGGRYGHNAAFPKKQYYWSNQSDAWKGSMNRDNTLSRWAVALQNDFAARMDWCVADSYQQANHAPTTVLNGDDSKRILRVAARPGETVTLTSTGTSDPDGNSMTTHWLVYPEAGTYSGEVKLSASSDRETSFVVPAVTSSQSIHVILEVRDNGRPNLVAYRRAIISTEPQ